MAKKKAKVEEENQDLGEKYMEVKAPEVVSKIIVGPVSESSDFANHPKFAKFKSQGEKNK